MSLNLCDWCWHPSPGEECPIHGPKAMEDLRRRLAALADAMLADALQIPPEVTANRRAE